MRSASALSRLVALSVASAALAFVAGCSTVSDNVGALREAVTPRSSSSKPVATGPAAVARPAPQVYDTPVNPLAQRAFDDAARALKSGRTDEAERQYRALANASPELGGPHANLGLIYRQAGKLPEAINEFETAVRLSPRQPVYLNQLGIAYRQKGEFAKARDAYQKAIALDPAYAAATLNLGILFDLYLGDPQRALDLYGRYLSLAPNGDPAVTKWVADLKNRKPAPITVSQQGKP
jgi:tetratricopeptide (TPR) repeat protein